MWKASSNVIKRGINSKQFVYSTNQYSNDSVISNVNKLKSKYDVVILGAGHNGLVAANYLAKSSQGKLKICVLERRHVIGGAAVTEEIIPGFKFSRASYLFSLFRPQIIKELDLMRHGILKFHKRDPSSYTPLLESDPQYTKNSRSLLLGPNSHSNFQEIAKFSKHDAQKYEEYENWLSDMCTVLEPMMDVGPPDLRILKENGKILNKLEYLVRYMVSVLNFNTANKLSKNVDDIYRLFAAPASDLLNEWFESDVLKATLATDSVIGAMLSPYSEGSAYVLLHHCIGGVEGQKGVWAYVEGGMGAVSQCLAHNAKSYGDSVEIYTSQEVKQIALDNSKTKVKGVELSDGKLIEADYVLSNVTPHVTFKKLLNSYGLEKSGDEETQKYFKRVDNIKYDSATMKINLAVSKLPNFLADPNVSESTPMPHHRCTIHINCENMNLIDEGYKDVAIRNRPSGTPMIEMVIPSSLDQTLAPKGQHVVLLFCQYFTMQNEKADPKSKEVFVNSVLDSIERYAPGFKSSIIGKDVLSPMDLENTFGLTGGNIFHGAMPLNQLFINRPVSGWCNYDTPINGLFLAGSGAHPGGGVMGSAGRLAGLRCLEEIKKRK